MLAVLLHASALAAPAANRRHLSYTQILGYSPGSQVTDHANIDLDQQALETELKTLSYTTAKDVYTTGAHSKPTAVCTLVSPTATSAALSKGDDVTFTSVYGDSATGKIYQDYESGVSELMFTYGVSEDRVQDATTTCYVGGMPSSDWATDGCIVGSSSSDAASGLADGQSTFTIGTDSFTATCTNRGKRTLQGFSTGAESKMYTCPTDTTKAYKNGCPYTSYEPYYDYYGDYSYADSIVSAALDATATSFTNGDQDFTTGDGATDLARVQMIKKGTAYMNAWMYVIREFEDAIDDCTNGDITANAGSSGPVHAWDEGVAFYVGSIMSPDDITGAELDTLDDKGKLAYTLGNKRCRNYFTCGPDGDEDIGEAKANLNLMDLFNAGQHKLLVGECADVVPIKNEIVSQMTVPLVQGTLRYAYKVAAASGGAKEKGEGAIFAAAVLPQVHACDATHAATIYDNIGNINAASFDYTAVKAAFEACYPSMGITCVDVGGLWNVGESGYYADGGFDASPCVDPVPPSPPAADASGMSDTALIIIIIVAVLAVILLLCMCYLISKEKSGSPVFASLSAPKQGA
jgi:hypothetical protein